MNIIVDASVAAKWFLEEEFADDARRVISEGNDLHVPDFFLLEMDSVFCKWIRRGVITESEGHAVRSTLGQLPVHAHSSSQLRDTAFALANHTARSLYDCLYIALAALLDGRMVTADRRLYDALSDGPLAGQLLWVEDIP